MKYFAILLRIQENRKEYQKSFFVLGYLSSVTRHLDSYLQEVPTIFSYKCQKSVSNFSASYPRIKIYSALPLGKISINHK